MKSGDNPLAFDPHPDCERLSNPELQEELARADGRLKLVHDLGSDADPLLEPWLIQRRRLILAELNRRTGQGNSSGDAKERIPITVSLSDVKREDVSWLWQDRIPLGKLTIIEGDPGLGKSWLCLAIATAVSKGFALTGDIAHEPARVILLTAEDGLSDTVRPRLEDMGADLTKVVALRGLKDERGQEQPLTLADLDVLEAAINEHGPSLVIVDPLVAYMAGRDTHKAGEVRGLLAPLAALAEKYGCAVVAVRHLNKTAPRAFYRGQGSIDFLAACRSAFLVGEDPENSELRVICHLKSNLAPKTPSLTFSLKEGRFLWGEESSLTAEQILAVPVQGEEKSQLNEAQQFIRDLLSSGPLSSSGVKKQAREVGIAEKTLWRAKTTLGVKAVKESFEGGWIWELPPPKMVIQAEDGHTNKMGAFDKNDHLRTEEASWEEV